MNWVTAFTLWLTSQNIPVDGVSGQGASAQIWYKSTATSAQISQAEAAKATFIAPTTPNIAAFEASIDSDFAAGYISFSTYQLLNGWLAKLQSALSQPANLVNPALIQGVWSAIVSNNSAAFSATYPSGAPQAGQTVQQVLQTYATADNIPL